MLLYLVCFIACSYWGVLLKVITWFIHSLFIVIFLCLINFYVYLIQADTSIWVSAQLNSASEHAALLGATKSTQSNINVLYFTLAFNAWCMQRPMKRKVCLSFSCIWHFWLEKRHGGGVNACKVHSEIRSKTLQHNILNRGTQKTGL